MSKYCRVASIAYEQALESKQTWRHGSVITKNGKIIVKGKNLANRTKCLNKIHSCIHAEIDVANQLIKRYVRKKITKSKKSEDIVKKYIVWVIRIGNSKENGKYLIKNSMPCNHCIDTLINLGFVKIGFSNDNGLIQVKKLKELKGYNTSSQLTYGKYFK